MKNIILQHWDSENLPEWAIAASNTMRVYAAKCGAEYRLLNGTPLFDLLPKRFCENPTMCHVSIQKLAFLSEEFDEYDQVCMYDMDMCATPWAKNVFDDPGSLNIWYAPQPGMSNSYRYPWRLTGGVYKFDRRQRKALRDVLLKLDLYDQSTLSGSSVIIALRDWWDESLLAALLHHPDSLLDPSSLQQIDVTFEAVVNLKPSSGRVTRPSRDEDVSVRHFMGHRKHLITPVVHKWYGNKMLKPSRLRLLVLWGRYFKAWLPELWMQKIVMPVINFLRRPFLAWSSLPLEKRAAVYEV